MSDDESYDEYGRPKIRSRQDILEYISDRYFKKNKIQRRITSDEELTEEMIRLFEIFMDLTEHMHYGINNNYDLKSCLGECFCILEFGLGNSCIYSYIKDNNKNICRVLDSLIPIIENRLLDGYRWINRTRKNEPNDIVEKFNIRQYAELETKTYECVNGRLICVNDSDDDESD